MRREDIFARDGYRCVFCGEVFPAEALSVDHLQPRSRGGDRSSGNLVTACGACNARKARQRLAVFLAGDPQAYANFKRLAVHAWKRHLIAIEEEVRKVRTRDS
jgi:5-methylcytosine-specific restriction endonuclease McrA